MSQDENFDDVEVTPPQTIQNEAAGEVSPPSFDPPAKTAKEARVEAMAKASQAAASARSAKATKQQQDGEDDEDGDEEAETTASSKKTKSKKGSKENPQEENVDEAMDEQEEQEEQEEPDDEGDDNEDTESMLSSKKTTPKKAKGAPKEKQPHEEEEDEVMYEPDDADEEAPAPHRSPTKGKGGKGKGGKSSARILAVAKRHQKKRFGKAIEGIGKKGIRRICYRAGIKTVGAGIYPQIRNLMEDIIDKIMKDAICYTSHSRRKTVTREDIIHAMDRNGYKMY
jgi:histone H4